MEKTGEMKKIDLISKNNAVAGVIEALLLVALVAIILSTIQLVYIPEIMEQKEAEHMDVISNQFTYLKSMMNIQQMTNSSDPLTSMITLGSRELPYFVTARATGDLSIVQDENCKITLWSIFNPTEFDLTSVKFESHNYYFVDQTYALEGGGVFVKQPTGKSVSRASASVSLDEGNPPKVSFTLPVHIGISDQKNMTSGWGKCMIRVNYSRETGNPQTLWNNMDNITINTYFPNAWNESFQDLKKSSDLLKITVINSEDEHQPSRVVIENINPGGKLNVYLKVLKYYVQIGPGWIK